MPVMSAWSAGLRLAAAHLEQTANAFDQMAEQSREAARMAGGNYLIRTPHLAAEREHSSKAALLRGQAKLIRELKP